MKVKLAELEIDLSAVIADQAKLVTEIERTKEAQRDLQKSTENLADSSEDERKQYVRNQTELKKLQGDYRTNEKLLLEQKNGVNGLSSALEKENKSVGDARKNNKQLLDLRNKINTTTKDGKKAVEEINGKLDKNNDFIKENVSNLEKQKINVGNYEKSVVSALGKVEILGVNLGQVAEKGINFAKSQKEAAASTNKGTKSLKGFKIALASTGIGLIIIALGALVAAFLKTQQGMDAVNRVMSQASAVINELIGRVAQISKGFLKWIGGSNEGLEEMKNAVIGVGDALVEAAEKGGKLADLQVVYRKLTKASKLLQAELQAEAEKFQAIADDATRSFAQQENAALKARELQERLANERIAEAKRALELLNLGDKLAIESAKERGELSDEQIDAINAVTEAESEQIRVLFENDKLRRQLTQDRLEKDLDILIDGFDNQKSINERRLKDDRLTFEERKKILDDTKKLSDESFDKQVETLQKFTDKQIDANDLLNESNAVVLNEKIRALGLSEIIEGRLLEVIRDRRTAEQDLSEASVELFKAEMAQKEKDLETSIENNLKLKEIKFDTEELIRIRAFNQELRDQENHNESIKNLRLQELEFFEELDIKRIEEESRRRKEAIISEIADMKLRDAMLRALETETEDAITDIHQQAADARIEIENEEFDKKLDKIVKGAKKILAVLSSINNARIESIKANAAIEIEKIEDRYNAEINRAGENATEIARLEAEKDQIIAKIEFEAAVREQKAHKNRIALAIAEAIINGLSASIKAFAINPFAGIGVALLAYGKIKKLIAQMKRIQNVGPDPEDFGLESSGNVRIRTQPEERGKRDRGGGRVREFAEEGRVRFSFAKGGLSLLGATVTAREVIPYLISTERHWLPEKMASC